MTPLEKFYDKIHLLVWFEDGKNDNVPILNDFDNNKFDNNKNLKILKNLLHE